MRINFKLITLCAAVVTLVSCDPSGVKTENPSVTAPVVDGAAPVSGKPLFALCDDAYSPLSFTKTISNGILGSAYMSSDEYPDIFVQCPTGLGASYGGMTGLNLCRCKGKMSDGHLVYDDIVPVSEYPWDLDEINVRILSHGGKIYAFQMTNAKLRMVEFDKQNLTFGSTWTSVNLSGISYAVSGFDIIPLGSDKFDVVFLRYNVSSYKPEMDDVTDSYYDSMGIYKGELPYGGVFRVTVDMAARTATSPVALSPNEKSIMAPMGVTHVSADGFDGYVLGNKFGTLKYLSSAKGAVVDYITDPAGKTLMNKSVMSNLCTVSSDNDAKYDDFISSGEGMLYLYRFSGRLNADGTPIYNEALPLLMQEGDLYPGSLSVPTIADWDSDGVNDLITGNSEGRLLYYKNYGTDAKPAFGKPQYLQSNGREICFRAGYYEVQGPMEAGWGYLCPNVIDWNGDGLLDIVFSSNEGKFEFMLNEGTPGNPRLGERQTIMLDGLELYGVWRCRPAVAKVNGRLLIMIMDDEDALHLYEKRTDDSVIDRGQVKLTNGQVITGYSSDPNFAEKALGYKGREKLELVDWDNDGDLDLLIGTPLQSSFPSPDYGLPWSRNPNRGMQTLYMENLGNNDTFKFAYPKQFQFRGADFRLGSHANSPCACCFGDTSKGLNLLVGCESGHFYFFNRYDLTTYTLW